MSWCEDEGIGGHDHDAGRRLMEEVLTATEINQIGTAVGILDQDGTGRKIHVQPGEEKARDRDLHQIRP